MATDTLPDVEDEVDDDDNDRNTVTSKRRKLQKENKYWYDEEMTPEQRNDVKIYYDDDTLATNFRPYSITNKKGDIQGFAFARNVGDALGLYAAARGFTARNESGKTRGRAEGSGSAKVDNILLGGMRMLWDRNDTGDRGTVAAALQKKNRKVYRQYFPSVEINEE